MKMIKREARAKLNLRLEVGPKFDGYHELESVVQEIELSDKLYFSNNNHLGVRVITDMDCKLEDNLVYKSAKLFEDYSRYKIDVDIILEKNIPVGAGLGGGSSDAALVLKTLNQMYSTNLSRKEMVSLGEELGSDVSFFLYGGTALCRGKGEVVKQLSDFPSLDFLIIVPTCKVSTKEAYSLLDSSREGHDNILRRTTSKILREGVLDYEGLDEFLMNDFEDVIIPKYPEIAEIKQGFERLLIPNLLSGSGSCVYGILPKDNQENVLRRLWAFEGFPGKRMIYAKSYLKKARL